MRNPLDSTMLPIKDREMKVTDKGTQFTNDVIFREALEKYLETLIELKGHAWCMDMREERRKMARLAVGVLANAAFLEREVRTVGPNELLVRCNCGKDVILRLLGGQYQDSYVGRCTCHKGWRLEDLPTKLPL